MALDFLLQPYEPGANAGPVLSRLVNMHFVRRERGLLLPAPGGSQPTPWRASRRTAAPARMAESQQKGRKAGPAYPQQALLRRAAQYFAETRRARQEWRSLDDLTPQLAEIDLRCAAGDYDDAAGVLREIDFDYLHAVGPLRPVGGIARATAGQAG